MLVGSGVLVAMPMRGWSEEQLDVRPLSWEGIHQGLARSFHASIERRWCSCKTESFTSSAEEKTASALQLGAAEKKPRVRATR